MASRRIILLPFLADNGEEVYLVVTSSNTGKLPLPPRPTPDRALMLLRKYIQLPLAQGDAADDVAKDSASGS